eukprot:scaffold76062_cov36-Phaeocystis_antarctica.AAC.1
MEPPAASRSLRKACTLASVNWSPSTECRWKAPLPPSATKPPMAADLTLQMANAASTMARSLGSCTRTSLAERAARTSAAASRFSRGLTKPMASYASCIKRQNLSPNVVGVTTQSNPPLSPPKLAT